jgi:predicted RNA-binding protein with PUA-like domain
LFQDKLRTSGNPEIAKPSSAPRPGGRSTFFHFRLSLIPALTKDGAVNGRYWLVKQEPADYPWSRFAQEGSVAWTGVRNFQARNHLRAMAPGDHVLFYHSGSEKSVVGLALVGRAAYPDPTASEGDWSAVDLKAVCPLVEPVNLAAIKKDALLKTTPLVRNSRLSVSPMTAQQFRRVLALSRTALPQP